MERYSNLHIGGVKVYETLYKDMVKSQKGICSQCNDSCRCCGYSAQSWVREHNTSCELPK